MSNLLKFDPEPFDSELPLEAFAGGTSLPDEQEEEARAGRSGARSAGRSGARSLRRIGRTASAATASAARVRPFSESAGRQAFGSTRRRASQPGAPGTKGNRHRRPYFYYRGRRRRIPGLV